MLETVRNRLHGSADSDRRSFSEALKHAADLRPPDVSLPEKRRLRSGSFHGSCGGASSDGIRQITGDGAFVGNIFPADQAICVYKLFSALGERRSGGF